MSSKTGARKGKQQPRLKLEPKRAYTDGADVAEFSQAYGLAPDAWQAMVLDAWLGRDEKDKFTATTCGLSVPRQNGKNAVIEMRELYGLVIIGEKILHTAHEVKTARKAFLRLAGFFENSNSYPELASMVKSIRKTNGQEAIELYKVDRQTGKLLDEVGATIEFSARSRGAARGFTVDVVVFDEAQELTEEQIEAMMSTMAAAPLGNRQEIYTGTPPSPTSPGEVFGRVRADALAKRDKHLSWHEWSIEEIEDNSNTELWYNTNPALGIRIDKSFVKKELMRLTEEGFARERLGWWASNIANAAISKNLWKKCATDDPPKEGKRAFGVKFSPDGSVVSVAVALKPKEGKTHIELVKNESMKKGISWLAEDLYNVKDKTSIIVIDGRSNADAFIERLKDLGYSTRGIRLAGTKGVIASASKLLNAIKEGSITHLNQDALNHSALNAQKRYIGKDGGFGFGAIGDADVTMIEAASMAYWGIMTTRRNPARKVRIL